ncbi:MAG: glycoside hydrolase family 1 protein [Bdellovibrionota bacterium]
MEGYNRDSDWWRWECSGHVAGGIGSGAATDHWNRFKEDLALAAGLGVNTYRFSLEWAKVEPQPEQWNEEAFAWYESLLDECERLGLMPMLTLHHFTLPDWVAQTGGFSNEKSVEYFVRFTRKVVDRMGARIPLWCTFNEPMVYAIGAFLGGFMPPAVQEPKLVSEASTNIFLAHAEAYSIIHSISERSGPWKDKPLAVGIAHNMLDFMPDRWWHPLEHILARFTRRFYNQSWLNAVTGKKQSFSALGLIPKSSRKLSVVHKTADFIGVNYYTKAYIRWRPRDALEGSVQNFPLGIAFARRNEEQSDVGWAFHPAGFRRILKEAGRCGLPLFVTENGLADKKDTLRAKYLVTHLKEIAKLIKEGLDIRGYYHWSLLDNFEWKEGFGPRFGLFNVDYSNFQRTERKSAGVYRDIIKAHNGNVPDQEKLGDFGAGITSRSPDQI